VPPGRLHSSTGLPYLIGQPRSLATSPLLNAQVRPSPSQGFDCDNQVGSFAGIDFGRFHLAGPALGMGHSELW